MCDTYHAFKNLSKNDVTSVQPGSGLCCDKELGSVRVLSSVSHRQPARAVVLQLEVLIREAITVDALTWE